MSKPESIETAIVQAVADTAPRVTPADIEAAIAGEHYFTAADALRFGWLTEDHDDIETRRVVSGIGGGVGVRSYTSTCMSIDDNAGILPAMRNLTFCVLVLRNGFTVTGESACVSAQNFNAEIGRKVARANAVSKIWPLLGYELRSKCAADQATA